MSKVREFLPVEASDQILDDYFQWLCYKVRVDEPDHSYWILAKMLHKREFYSLVPNDENRENEGKALRYLFWEENPYPGIIDTPCSVFEMLIALSIRAADLVGKPGEESEAVPIFWEMITNLGLDDYTDEHYPDISQPNLMFDEIISKFLDRKYRKNGKGGLFPLRHTKKDQRKVEIWYQMSEYLEENYPI